MAFKIYTRTGDKGTTSLFGGARVPKYHVRIEAYGTTDELNAHLGLIRDQIDEEACRTFLYRIQNELFTLGAMLATDPDKKQKLQVPQLEAHAIERLEQEIDRLDMQLEPLKNFVLPGGHPIISQCHIARCVCRRAERLCVALHETEQEVEPVILQYLNRLSDYLFTLGRYMAKYLEVEEILWKS